MSVYVDLPTVRNRVSGCIGYCHTSLRRRRRGCQSLAPRIRDRGLSTPFPIHRNIVPHESCCNRVAPQPDNQFVDAQSLIEVLSLNTISQNPTRRRAN
jgi:hypothetical protein